MKLRSSAEARYRGPVSNDADPIICASFGVAVPRENRLRILAKSRGARESRIRQSRLDAHEENPAQFPLSHQPSGPSLSHRFAHPEIAAGKSRRLNNNTHNADG